MDQTQIDTLLVQAKQLADDVLEARLYGVADPGGRGRPVPDCAYLHTERKKPGVTLELLHLEYLEQHPDGYRYTRFCDLYRQWLARHQLSMRQEHRAGEKIFVDYAGQKPHLVDLATGAITAVELFVGVLGASNYTYAEATRTQQLSDWLGSSETWLCTASQRPSGENARAVTEFEYWHRTKRSPLRQRAQR